MNWRWTCAPARDGTGGIGTATSTTPDGSATTRRANDTEAFQSIQDCTPWIVTVVASAVALKPRAPIPPGGAWPHVTEKAAFPTWGIEVRPIGSDPAHPGVDAPYALAPVGSSASCETKAS